MHLQKYVLSTSAGLLGLNCHHLLWAIMTAPNALLDNGNDQARNETFLRLLPAVDISLRKHI